MDTSEAAMAKDIEEASRILDDALDDALNDAFEHHEPAADYNALSTPKQPRITEVSLDDVQIETAGATQGDDHSSPLLTAAKTLGSPPSAQGSPKASPTKHVYDKMNADVPQADVRDGEELGEALGAVGDQLQPRKDSDVAVKETTGLVQRGNVDGVDVESVVTKSPNNNPVFSGEVDVEAQNQRVEPRPVQTQLYEDVWKVYCHKGNVSNLITFTIMVFGLILTWALPTDIWICYWIARIVLSFGLFGFAGGITNWLAIKMLFDRIPGLYGSGIIPMRFKEIRETVKNTIMRTFFDPEYLNKYMKDKMESMRDSLDLESSLRTMLESDAVDALIDKKLQELFARPEAMMLMMMNFTPQTLKPMIKPFVVGMATDVAPLLVDMIDLKKILDVDKLRNEIDSLMENKLQELTPPKVKKMIESVILCGY